MYWLLRLYHGDKSCLDITVALQERLHASHHQQLSRLFVQLLGLGLQGNIVVPHYRSFLVEPIGDIR